YAQGQPFGARILENAQGKFPSGDRVNAFAANCRRSSGCPFTADLPKKGKAHRPRISDSLRSASRKVRSGFRDTTCVERVEKAGISVKNRKNGAVMPRRPMIFEVCFIDQRSVMSSLPPFARGAGV